MVIVAFRYATGLGYDYVKEKNVSNKVVYQCMDSENVSEFMKRTSKRHKVRGRNHVNKLVKELWAKS